MAAAVAWIALILFGLVSLYALFVGLTFGGALWNLGNLKPTLWWLGVVATPLPIALALKWRRHSPLTILLSVVAACALMSPYLLALQNR